MGGGSLYNITSCLAAWSHVPLGGISAQGGLCQGDPPLPYSEEWAVCILLECFLLSIFSKIVLSSFICFHERSSRNWRGYHFDYQDNSLDIFAFHNEAANVLGTCLLKQTRLLWRWICLVENSIRTSCWWLLNLSISRDNQQCKSLLFDPKLDYLWNAYNMDKA